MDRHPADFPEQRTGPLPERAKQGLPPPTPDFLSSTWAPKKPARADVAVEKLSGSFSSQRSGRPLQQDEIPEPGDSICGFFLHSQLGEGSFARVFLAQQADLSGRPVVLKISRPSGDEPQTLAQLQHTNIVPIYSLHEDKHAGLRVLCMPYFGGASAAEVFGAMWQEDARPSQGQSLARVLARLNDRRTVPVGEAPAPQDGEDRESRIEDRESRIEDRESRIEDRESRIEDGESKIEDSKDVSVDPRSSILDPRSSSGAPPWAGETFVRAVAWIIGRLAQGLQHAHNRGILHRDVKPSNILLAADGEPMLLDFNIAQRMHSTQCSRGTDLSGTLGYMSPEHLRALALRDSRLVRQVGHRSDIYSLGLVFFEMLTGEMPFKHADTNGSNQLPTLEGMVHNRAQINPSARKHRHAIPWSLESILRKCLAVDPEQRYQQAAHLAEDCQRFLDHRPLRYAPELSRVERIRKWMRRHPRWTSAGLVAAVAGLVLLGLAGALASVHDNLATTGEELAQAQSQERQRSYKQGAVRAVCLINTFTDLQDHLRDGIAVCEDTLALYQVLDRDDWQQSEAWQRLTPTDQDELAEDARELLVLLAWARVRSAPEKTAANQAALRLLDRAEAIQGLSPSQALWQAKALYLQDLGRMAEARAAQEKAAALRPRSARDYYLLAAHLARRGLHARAIDELNRALQLNPSHYWSTLQRGICYQELGKPALAAADFGTCIGLWPEFAWGYFNRGYALAKSGNRPEAIASYGQAIEKDPKLVLAYVNRGMAYLQNRDYAKGLADFHQVAGLGRDDAFLHAGLGMALEGLKQPHQADSEFAQAFARFESLPKNSRRQIQLAYGFAVFPRLPNKAAEAFQKILAESPDHAEALYGQAMVLVEKKQETAGLELFNNLLEIHPNFVEARRYRAILLARRGDLTNASRDINWCLGTEPEAGATFYAGACVAALAAQKSADPAAKKQATDQALAFLQRALEKGYGADRAAQDPDLEAILELPETQRLLQRPDAVRPAKKFPGE